MKEKRSTRIVLGKGPTYRPNISQYTTPRSLHASNRIHISDSGFKFVLFSEIPYDIPVFSTS